MKILHVVPGISASFGGPSKAVIEMCRELRSQGLEVDMATTDADVRSNISMPLNRPVEVDGATVWCFRSPWMRKYGFSSGLTRWLKAHVAEYDILHIHGFFSYIPFPGAHYAGKGRVPYIIRPMGHLDPWCFHQNRLVKRAFYQVWGRHILGRARAIHVTSEMERQGLMHLGFAEKCVVIPLGVEVSSPRVNFRRPSVSNHVPRILFLSRVDPKKGLPVLFEALRLLKDRGARLKATVAGSGQASYVHRMRKVVQRLLLEQEVDFLGFVAGEQKIRCLAEADLFVLPSYSENFGFAVIEAMGSGLPVVISDRVAFAGEVEAEGAGLVIPAGSVNALAEAIVQILSDPIKRKEMGNRARQVVEQRFTWPRVGEQLVKLYCDIVKG